MSGRRPPIFPGMSAREVQRVSAQLLSALDLQMNRPQIEEKVIIDAARRLLETLPRLTENFEIVFANDGSTDGTGELLNELKAKYKSIKVTGYQSNKGAGYAFRKALEIANGQCGSCHGTVECLS